MRVFFLQGHSEVTEGSRTTYRGGSFYDVADELAERVIADGKAETEEQHAAREAAGPPPPAAMSAAEAGLAEVAPAGPITSQGAVMYPPQARPKRASDPQPGVCLPAMSKKEFAARALDKVLERAAEVSHEGTAEAE